MKTLRSIKEELVSRRDGVPVGTVRWRQAEGVRRLRLALDAGTSILQRLHLDLASLSIAEFYPDGNASVRLVNQTSYLG